MHDEIEKVKEFHRVFEQPINENPTLDLPDDVKKLRVDLIDEENRELKKALDENDIVGVLDALEDLQYVLLGAVITFGMQPVYKLGFDEVHSSNMSKLGPDGKPMKKANGKVAKPDTYRSPDLAKILEMQRTMRGTDGQ